LQSRLCGFFPFCSIQHPKKNKTNKTQTQETKKQIAYLKRGKMQRVGSCYFLKGWQDKKNGRTQPSATSLSFVCAICCGCLLFAVGLWFHGKTTTRPRKNVGIIGGSLWFWDMD
jgi:hypothetical protein